MNSLAARKKAQMETVNQFKVFYQFQFTDKVKESGVTFVHHAVEESTRNYMSVHYDHGSGIVVADVDGDGLYDIYFVNQFEVTSCGRTSAVAGSRTSPRKLELAYPVESHLLPRFAVAATQVEAD